MPEDPMALHVVGRTANGQLWHTIRQPGGWLPFGDILAASGLGALAGEVVDAACARRLKLGSGPEEGLYVLVAFAQERPRLLFRSADTGQWHEEAAPAFPVARQVAVATNMVLSQGQNPPSSVVHLAVVTDDGILLAASQAYETGQPGIPINVELSAGPRGDLRAAGLLSDTTIDGVSTELLAVSSDGSIFTADGSAGAWSEFQNLDTNAGPGVRPGDVLAADAAVTGSGTDYVIVTGDGHVWIASSFSNGTWSKWRDLETYTATFTGGFSGTFTATHDVGTFNTVNVAVTSEGTQVLGTTTNGHLWHQLRSMQMPVFQDVEIVGVREDVGSFTTVSAA